MPLLPDFAASYQWLRELKRRHGEPMMGVHFTLKSEEVVLVGRYSEPHATLPLREAIRRVMAAPAGAEIVVPRSVARRDVLGFRAVGQLVGWTGVPSGERKIDCVCPACLAPGTPDFLKRVRAAFDRLALEARKATSDDARGDALARMNIPLERARGRIPPNRILPYARAESEKVRRETASQLALFRWADVEATLMLLVVDAAPSVRRVASASIVRSAGLRRAWPLLEGLDDDVQVALVEQLVFNTHLSLALGKLETLAAKGSRRVVRAVQRDLELVLAEDDLDASSLGRLEALAAR